MRAIIARKFSPLTQGNDCNGQAIKVAKLYTHRPKAQATLIDVREGRTSFSSHLPIVVSRLDSVRGGFYIVDGNHRAIEAALRGDRSILATLDPNVPRIERTGGAYTCWTSDMVRPLDMVHS